MKELYFQPAHKLVSLIKSGKLSPTQLIEASLSRIEAINGSINAFVALRAEQALAEAKDLEKKLARGSDPGPLCGIPFGVKDLEDTEGMATTYGSIPFKDNFASRDSIQVQRLKRAGAIVLGKTNTPEFGFTGFTKNRLFGVTRNPWNTELTPGGSSGGSAAAVASGMVPFATGSDAGGSIRIPACYTGCFGIKPTYGRIPLGPFDVMPMSRLWNLGPITRTVEDAALYLDVVSGYHPCDPDSIPAASSTYLSCLPQLPKNLKIAFSMDLGFAPVQKQVRDAINEAINVFEDLGHVVEEWKGVFPDVSEAWSELVCLDIYGLLGDKLAFARPEMGRTLVFALDHAASLSATRLLEHQKIRCELNSVLKDIFTTFDLFITPTLPTEPFGAKGPPPGEIDGVKIPILWAVAFTYPFNFSGHPAATVRAGLPPEGLPVGLQIVAERHREDLVLQASYAFQQAKPWNSIWPSI